MESETFIGAIFCTNISLLDTVSMNFSYACSLILLFVCCLQLSYQTVGILLVHFNFDPDLVSVKWSLHCCQKNSFFMFFYQLSSKSFLTIHLLYIFHQMRPQSFPTAGHIHPQEHIYESLTMLVYCKSDFLTWVCSNRQMILQGMTHATFWALTHVPSSLKINAIKKT